MTAVLASDVLTAIPFGIGFGAIVAIIYTLVRMLGNIISVLPTNIKMEVVKGKRSLKEIFSDFKAEKPRLGRGTLVAIDIIMVSLSAMIFPIISYILLDGALRVELYVVFIIGFVSARVAVGRISSSIQPFLSVVIIATLLIFLKIVSQFIKIARFFIRLISKKKIFARFLPEPTRTDKM